MAEGWCLRQGGFESRDVAAWERLSPVGLAVNEALRDAQVHDLRASVLRLEHRVSRLQMLRAFELARLRCSLAALRDVLLDLGVVT